MNRVGVELRVQCGGQGERQSGFLTLSGGAAPLALGSSTGAAMLKIELRSGGISESLYALQLPLRVSARLFIRQMVRGRRPQSSGTPEESWEGFQEAEPVRITSC